MTSVGLMSPLLTAGGDFIVPWIPELKSTLLPVILLLIRNPPPFIRPNPSQYHYLFRIFSPPQNALIIHTFF